MLFEGRKFDLRIYVMVRNVQTMEAYLASEGLVRICTHDYHKPSKSNMHNLLSHLTNFSLNKLDSNFVVAENLE